MRRWIRTGVVLVALTTGSTACGSGSGDGSGPADGAGGTLTVFAASSLTATFTDLAREFEAEHDGVTVRLAFAGSSDLVAQVQGGAPADVIASADTANMDTLVTDGLVGSDPVVFATNTLEIVVPPGNPADVRSLDDLADPTLNLVVCAPVVPCGAAAGAVARAGGVTLSPVSEEQSVTDVLTKVETGEADAGLVYVTDVQAAGDRVTGIGFAESGTVVNSYPIAPVADSAHPALAAEFVDLVTGDRGRRVLREAGFGLPGR